MFTHNQGSKQQTQFPAQLQLFPYLALPLVCRCLLMLWEEREGLAFLGVFWEFLCWNYWCSVACHLCHPPSFFFLPLLSTVIAALKFIIVLRVLSSHPHSAAETMKKAAMCPMTHEINNPCKQLVGKMSHMSSFWMSGAFQKAGNRGSVKTALADTRVCIRTWAADLRKFFISYSQICSWMSVGLQEIPTIWSNLSSAFSLVWIFLLECESLPKGRMFREVLWVQE